MIPVLYTQRLVLKPLSSELTPQVTAYFHRNIEYFRQWFPAYEDNQFTETYQQERLLIQTERIQKGEEARWGIFHKTDENQSYLLGVVAVTNIVRGVLQNCYLGYNIDERAAKQGLTTEALKVLIPYIFNELKLHRIEAHVMPANKGSIRIMQKLGFENEGKSRQFLLINGAWEDHLRFSLINPNPIKL